MNERYARAYTEVLEIIKHFSKEEYSKIPISKINFYQENADKNYKFEINPMIDLSKQNISEEANAILITLFRDYFASEEQKETLKRLLNQNQEKLEEQKREKYNVDNIFGTKELENKEEKVLPEQPKTEIIEYKEPFFKKFLNYIKRILRIK